MALFRLNERVCGTTGLMRRMMHMCPEGAGEAERVLTAEFAQVSRVLESHAYLGSGTGSDAFGGADLAWAALTGSSSASTS